MNNKDRAPLIRIAKRSDAVLAPYKVWGIRLASLLIALVITLAKPLLSFNRQLLNQFLVIHSFNVLFIVIIIFPQR